MYKILLQDELKQKYNINLIAEIEQLSEEYLFLFIKKYIGDFYKKDAQILLYIGINEKKCMFKILCSDNSEYNFYFYIENKNCIELIKNMEVIDKVFISSETELHTFKYVFKNIKQAQLFNSNDLIYFYVDYNQHNVRVFKNWNLCFRLAFHEFREFKNMITRHNIMMDNSKNL